MKTKIIYISGSEIFEMADIRAAFDEVRNALGLEQDTILFGVPVDCDNALINKQSENTENVVIDNLSTIESESVEPENNLPETIVCENESQTPEIQTTETEDKIEEPHVNATETENTQEKIIPILSVLATGEEENIQNTESLNDETEENIIDETDITAEDINTEDTETANVTTQINVDIISVTPDTETNHIDIQKINISETINEEIPEAQNKQTLEQLLESMTPLREDVHESEPESNDDELVVGPELTISDNEYLDEDTDATLAQLASEFAETEDKIITTKKSEPQGKIGKLKNILPFKKIKREDNSLMGDLFGWAGIAANDEDFSIPGFFTQHASKKQGA